MKGLNHWNVPGLITTGPISWAQLCSDMKNGDPDIGHISWTGGGGHDEVLCGAWTKKTDKKRHDYLQYMNPITAKKPHCQYSYYVANSSWYWYSTIRCPYNQKS